MSVPTGPAGHSEAAQPAAQVAQTSEDLGPGYIFGNVTADPEMRYTQNGDAVTRVRIAHTERIKNPDGKTWRDGPTDFYDIIVWKHQAERTVEHLRQGDRIIATGQWTKRNWTDREGKLRTTTELTARDIGPSLLFRDVTVHRPDKANGNA